MLTSGASHGLMECPSAFVFCGPSVSLGLQDSVRVKPAGLFHLQWLESFCGLSGGMSS